MLHKEVLHNLYFHQILYGDQQIGWSGYVARVREINAYSLVSKYEV
jgi:hypothetical protein